MQGTKGFRARVAAANYKRRDRRLVSEEVRALRAAHLPGTSFHGNAEDAAAAAIKPTQEESARANAALVRAAAEQAAAEKAAEIAAAQAPAETPAEESKVEDKVEETKAEEPKAEDKPHKGKKKK